VDRQASGLGVYCDARSYVLYAERRWVRARRARDTVVVANAIRTASPSSVRQSAYWAVNVSARRELWACLRRVLCSSSSYVVRATLIRPLLVTMFLSLHITCAATTVSDLLQHRNGVWDSRSRSLFRLFCFRKLRLFITGVTSRRPDADDSRPASTIPRQPGPFSRLTPPRVEGEGMCQDCLP